MSRTQVKQECATQSLEASSTGAFTIPELLTLQGLYATTKSVYTTYMPTVAAKFIGGVSQSLFKASSPFVVKAIPASASSEWKSLENGDVANINSLLTSYFAAGDETIDNFINTSTDRVYQTYTNYKETAVAEVVSLKSSIIEKFQGFKPQYETAKTQVTEKFETAKTQVTDKLETTKVQVTEKLETAKTQVTEKIETAKVQVTDRVNEKYESAKAVVQSKLEDERIVAVMEQAKPYIELVKENVEPAKEVLSEMATSAQAEVSEKGYVEFAKESAESIRDQGLDVIETCKAKGTVEGVKDISNQVLGNIVNKLEDAKRRQH
jgi:hypothetical protein